MKLKELHIRNIASIESADIDFENGLNDAVTGTPAPIFLISGETGAGKSVILDGISMALYKKTPRIAGVANSKNNKYPDAKGETISVSSIEQYTRIGISERDDCYSEVVFEGNDGKTYHARLSLGMMRSRGNETLKLKHRTPTWEYRIDDGDWIRDNTEQVLQQAVGLSFQQFGRMAMLAQGQFANFLTGDKKEREDILEQLTNTKHFSDYGEAINRLFNKAKTVKQQIQTSYETEQPHTLSEEELGRSWTPSCGWWTRCCKANAFWKNPARKYSSKRPSWRAKSTSAARPSSRTGMPPHSSASSSSSSSMPGKKSRPHTQACRPCRKLSSGSVQIWPFARTSSVPWQRRSGSSRAG